VKTSLRLGILILAIAFVTSCSQNRVGNETAIIGLEDVKASEVNTRIRITAPVGYNTFKINDLVALDIQNYSDQQVRFTNNDIHIFIEMGDEWSETKNNFYETRPFIVVGAKSLDNLGALVVISPTLSNQGIPIILRIDIVGIVYRNDKPTSIKTGAYVDVTLYP